MITLNIYIYNKNTHHTHAPSSVASGFSFHIASSFCISPTRILYGERRMSSADGGVTSHSMKAWSLIRGIHLRYKIQIYD